MRVQSWIVSAGVVARLSAPAPPGAGPPADPPDARPAPRIANPHQAVGCAPLRAVTEAAPGRPFAWYAAEGLEGIAGALARHPYALARLPALGSPEAVLGEGVEVWVVEHLECPGRTSRPRPPDWVAGWADPEERRIALRVRPGGTDLAGLAAVFRHEVAHLALAVATGGAAPRWLHEGYAQYASGAWGWNDAWRLRWALLLRGHGLLEDLTLPFPVDREGARLAYVLSYTAVHELLAIGGEPGFAAFLAALDETRSVDAALRRVYGLTEGTFERRWQRMIAGRYGLLFYLSRVSAFWVAVTLLLLWAGRRRRRRDRERLEELREWERRDPAAIEEFFSR